MNILDWYHVGVPLAQDIPVKGEGYILDYSWNMVYNIEFHPSQKKYISKPTFCSTKLMVSIFHNNTKPTNSEFMPLIPFVFCGCQGTVVFPAASKPTMTIFRSCEKRFLTLVSFRRIHRTDIFTVPYTVPIASMRLVYSPTFGWFVW